MAILRATAVSYVPYTILELLANLVLQDSVERIFVGESFGDIPRGVFVVRGENVALLGEVDLDKEDEISLQEIPVERALMIRETEKKGMTAIEKQRKEVLHRIGFSNEKADSDLY